MPTNRTWAHSSRRSYSSTSPFLIAFMKGEKTSSKRGCWERREAEGKRPCRRRRGMRYVRINLGGVLVQTARKINYEPRTYSWLRFASGGQCFRAQLNSSSAYIVPRINLKSSFTAKETYFLIFSIQKRQHPDIEMPSNLTSCQHLLPLHFSIRKPLTYLIR